MFLFRALPAAILFVGLCASACLADDPYYYGNNNNINSSASSDRHTNHLEIVPYAWFTGMKGDVRVDREFVSADQDLDKLFDCVDVGGSLVLSVGFSEWITYAQADFVSIDTNDIDDAPEGTRLNYDAMFLTGAFGRRFSLNDGKSTFDAMGGVRYARMEGELDFSGTTFSENAHNHTDFILMIRPNFRVLEWLSIDVPFSAGLGSSDLTYDLQPQVHFHLTDALQARAGYRILYYDTGGGNSSVDATYHGFLTGMGFVF